MKHRHLPGRPRLDDDDDTVNVTIRLPSRAYDRVYEDAQRDRLSVSEFIRRRADLAKSDRSKY